MFKNYYSFPRGRLASSPCRHDQCILLHHYIGNIALVERLRQIVSQLSSDPEDQYPVIWKQVVYSGTHCGDWLDQELVIALHSEVQRVRSCDLSLLDREDVAYLTHFLSQMEELAMASLSVNKPICF